MIAIILEWILGCVLLARNLARWGCRLGFPDLACETLDAIEWPPHRRRLEIEWLPESVMRAVGFYRKLRCQVFDALVVNAVDLGRLCPSQ